MWGAQTGDRVRLQIFDPAGAQIANVQSTVDKPQVLSVRWQGLTRTGQTPWAAARFRGVATVERDLPGRVWRQSREGFVDMK